MFFSEKNLCIDCFVESLDDEERKAYDMGRLCIFEGDEGYCDKCGGYEAIVEDFSYSDEDEDDEEYEDMNYAMDYEEDEWEEDDDEEEDEDY